MPHLAKGLGFDLANTLAGNVELAPNFFQRARIAVDQAETQCQDFLLTLRQGLQNIADLFLQQAECGHFIGLLGRLIFDKVAKVRIVAVTDRTLQ